MHLTPDPVTYILTANRIPVGFNVGLDSIRDIADPVSCHRLFNALEHCFLGDFQQSVSFLRNLSYPEGLGVVAHETVEFSNDITGNYIALVKDNLLGGDTVDQLLVYREAVMPRKSAIALARR